MCLVPATPFSAAPADRAVLAPPRPVPRHVFIAQPDLGFTRLRASRFRPGFSNTRTCTLMSLCALWEAGGVLLVRRWICGADSFARYQDLSAYATASAYPLPLSLHSSYLCCSTTPQSPERGVCFQVARVQSSHVQLGTLVTFYSGVIG